MKNVIRYDVFETNSSSVHSLCVCNEEEYKKFKKRDLVLDTYKLELIPRPEDFEKYNVFGEEIEEESRYIEYNYAPDAELNFTTPSGDKMVAFCYEIYYD